MKYLDSNVFIYAATLPQSSSKARKCKKILLDMADGKLHAATASLTWDELVWVIKGLAGNDAAAKEGRKFMELANLKILSVDESVLRVAQGLIEKYRLDPRDAIHAAAAVDNGIADFVSYDSDFDDIKELSSSIP